MDIFHMTDIISMLGLPFPTHGRSSYYVQCPCCDDNARQRHLNINLKKEVFRCPKCGISGGMFDLYALYTGIPRDKVRSELIKKAGSPDKTAVRQQKILAAQPVVEECPITDVETRHATYSALLARLSLSPDHRRNLHNRGLTDDDIERFGYKTTPVMGTTAIARQLQSEGCYLAGVPGFYRTEDNAWSFVNEKRGILIPVRDTNGYIQGLQIRRDDCNKRKFRWVSSAEKKDGCRAEGWTHFVGPLRPLVVLTEGPMKSDVIHALTGLTVLAVPGVNALTQLRLTLEILRNNGLEEIKTALDMDFLTNWHVQSGYANLLSLLNDMGFKFGTYIWDPKYKGLDDYVYALVSKNNRPDKKPNE